MISISEHNRKVAISRWSKVFDSETRKFHENSLNHPGLKSRIIGYLIGDGCVSVRRDKNGTTHHSIAFYPDDAHMLRSFLEAFRIIYDANPISIGLSKYYITRLESKPIVCDLMNSANFYSMDWTIPEMNSSDEKKEFLRAIYDCEGYVGKNVIAIQSVNKNGLESIKILLEEFGISSRLYSYKRKKDTWNINYLLYILKADSRRNFLKHIGFSHKRKQIKLELYAGVA